MVSLPEVSINTNQSASLCFGCGQNNPIGLRLNFKFDGKTVSTELTPGTQFQGWPGLLHGGIIACILDEALSWAARFAGRNCLTAKLNIKFAKPVAVELPLVITATITRNTRKLVESTAKIALRDGTVIAEASAVQYVVDDKSARHAGSTSNA